jgi:Zn-dependent oligopeptidase
MFCRLSHFKYVSHSRNVNVGLFYLRQLFFAKFDLQVHTDQGTQLQLNVLDVRDADRGETESTDYTKLWNDLRESISLVKSGKPCPGQG